MESSSSRLMWFLGLVVLQVLAAQFQISLCTGCLEQERTALLQIKASMSEYSTPYYTGKVQFPESWDSGRSDCCGWRGVECDITTGKVIKLLLYAVSTGWPLNASVFLPFEDLAHLDLSANFITSWVPNNGLERLSALSKLQVLILNYNSLNDTILPSLGQLSSLRTLSLSENMLEGSFELFGDLGLLHALNKLEVLDLSWNRFNNSILPSLGLHSTLKALSLAMNKFTGSIDFRELSFMSNIEELDLSDNGLTDVKGLESLGKLKVLTLRGNRLNGSRTILQSAGAFRSSNGSSMYSNLLELDLSRNDLEGMIPSWLRNFTSLRVLDLSDNQFEGNLALSPVADLNTLECLSISDSNLEIPLSLTPFFNHSKLKVLIADNNRLLNDKVEFHIPRLTPKFQLRALSFSNCLSDTPITELPNFIRHQTDLRLIDLSHINLITLPSWLVVNNSLLEVCNMRNNSLTGSFLFPSHRLFPQMTALDLSNNGLASQALETIGRVFPRLEMLNISGNLFGGPVPTSMGKLKYLRGVDLSNNYLSGEIPTMDCPSLQLLRLSHNSMSGQLPPSLYNLTSLWFLYLEDNHFVGEIPDISPAFSLFDFDLSHNDISGKLPRWIGNMTFLSQVALASNHLEGSIPVEFCNLGHSFQFLDLSDNDLSGSIPSCFNPPDIRHVHLNRNKLSGPMTSAFYNSPSLVTLDLLDNNLRGPIPSWIGNLSSLSVLLLKLNNFHGAIPLQLCNLKSLSILDLSQNSLSGQVPLCLTNMPLWVWGKSYELSFSSISVDIGTLLYDAYPQRLRTSGADYRDSFVHLDSRYANHQVEFSTKFGSYSYKGSVLDLMSGIDLSCNHLTGEIPAGIGNLSDIHALNMSHNHLTGSIPMTFSNLTAIESLDLSYNNLNGRIPPQLVELVSLGTFSVAHNNLSGPLPDRKAQFGTFDEKSYEGNPLLCGPPLLNSCSTKTGSPENPQAPEKEIERDDMVDFYASCAASYVTVLITIAAVLVINPRWRRAWLYHVEVWMAFCYYFVLDTIRSVINRRRIV